jgi:hypothetical protein
MKSAPSRHDQSVRPDGIAVGEVERDLDAGIRPAGVEETSGFMALERPTITAAVSGNVPFGDRPPLPADRLHFHPWSLAP